MRKKADIRKKQQVNIYDISSPMEKVIQILQEVRELIVDPGMYKDVNYCIKEINSGKLYEANIDSGISDAEGKGREAMDWFKEMSNK